MPGPGWHLPRPLETHETINFTGIRSVEKRTTMLTKDENIVELAFSVQYRIKSAEDYLFNVENPDIPGDRTCFWSRGPVSSDPYINIAYPDAGVFYWSAVDCLIV